MTKKKVLVYIICAICLVGAYALYVGLSPQDNTNVEQAFAAEPSDVIQEEWMATEMDNIFNTKCVARQYAEQLKNQGFNTIWERQAFIDEKNAEYIDKYNEDYETLGKFISDEDNEALKSYAETISTSLTCKAIQENECKYNEIIEKAKEEKKKEEERIAAEKAAAEKRKKQNAYYNGTNGKLTKSKGVNYYNGRRETYYSSRVLYHYMTPQWTLGSDGVYRENGYVVVAASDLFYGSLVDTSLGMGIVRDCGCAPGTTDIYVNW